MEETNFEEKNTIIQILSSTKWKDCVNFVKIRSMSNYIYLCSYNNTKIILRIYGQLNSHCKQVLNMNEPMEIISSYIIGKNELGPQLYMIFQGGRIEEYINDSITLRDLPLEKITNLELNRIVAQKLARFHSLNVPIPNDTMKVFETTKKIFESMFSFKHSLKTDFANVWEWCAPLLCGICNKGGMVFSHYDFSLNNILIKKTAINQITKHDDIMFVDFEYSCYGFGESDIATYFNTWDVDTSNPLGVLSYPKPTDEIKYNFVVDYLREKKKLQMNSFDESLVVSLFEIQTTLFKVAFFQCLNNIMLVIWSLTKLSDIDTFKHIDKEELAKKYEDRFLELKEKFELFWEKYFVQKEKRMTV